MKSTMNEDKSKIILVCVVCIVAVLAMIFGIAKMSGAEPATKPAPAPPTETSLAISEAWGELLQVAYAQQQAIQQLPATKALEAAQKVYQEALAKAQQAQGVPPDCTIKKGQWVKQANQNVASQPCLIPVPETSKEKK